MYSLFWLISEKKKAFCNCFSVKRIGRFLDTNLMKVSKVTKQFLSELCRPFCFNLYIELFLFYFMTGGPAIKPANLVEFRCCCCCCFQPLILPFSYFFFAFHGEFFFLFQDNIAIFQFKFTGAAVCLSVVR